MMKSVTVFISFVAKKHKRSVVVNQKADKEFGAIRLFWQTNCLTKMIRLNTISCGLFFMFTKMRLCFLTCILWLYMYDKRECAYVYKLFYKFSVQLFLSFNFIWCGHNYKRNTFSIWFLPYLDLWFFYIHRTRI